MNRTEIITKFLDFDSGNVCDAMDLLGLRRSVVRGLCPLTQNQRKTVGFARTIKQIRKKADDKNTKARHSAFIDEELKPGDLLVIDTSGITDVCTGGFILSLLAKTRGCTGELTNGCLRDVGDIAQLDFPIWYAGPCPVRSAADLQTLATDCPVMVGGVQICPGDLVLMDASGVVVVPADQIEAVATYAINICTREEKTISLLHRGYSLIEAKRISDPMGSEAKS